LEFNWFNGLQKGNGIVRLIHRLTASFSFSYINNLIMLVHSASARVSSSRSKSTVKEGVMVSIAREFRSGRLVIWLLVMFFLGVGSVWAAPKFRPFAGKWQLANASREIGYLTVDRRQGSAVLELNGESFDARLEPVNEAGGCA
jgi:hypothetical protein